LINLIHSNKDNLKYILINNQSHQSVGGQASIFKGLDETNLLIGLGFKEVLITESEKDLIQIFPKFRNSKKTALVIRVSNQSREDLSRPKETPIQNKIEFMKLNGQGK
jgi:phosphonopyruvate decarboxylase